MNKTSCYIHSQFAQLGKTYLRNIPNEGHLIDFKDKKGELIPLRVSKVLWYIQDESHVVSEIVHIYCDRVEVE